jgi:hypothetical protein
VSACIVWPGVVRRLLYDKGSSGWCASTERRIFRHNFTQHHKPIPSCHRELSPAALSTHLALFRYQRSFRLAPLVG